MHRKGRSATRILGSSITAAVPHTATAVAAAAFVPASPTWSAVLWITSPRKSPSAISDKSAFLSSKASVIPMACRVFLSEPPYFSENRGIVTLVVSSFMPDSHPDRVPGRKSRTRPSRVPFGTATSIAVRSSR